MGKQKEWGVNEPEIPWRHQSRITPTLTLFYINNKLWFYNKNFHTFIMGGKKWINTAAVLFTLTAYQTAEPLLSCFHGKKWKTKLENTEEGKGEKENMNQAQ